MKTHLTVYTGNMKLPLLIKFWGFVDICYVAWVVYRDIISNKLPFIDRLLDAIIASVNFELIGVTAITIAGAIVSLTVIISGVLMLMLNKWGIYISLLQAPFRLFLIIPPTFFFLSKILGNAPVAGWIVIAIILAIEILKVVTELLWLKNTKG